VVGQRLRVGQVQTSQILELINEHILYLGLQLLAIFGEKEEKVPLFVLYVEFFEPLGGKSEEPMHFKFFFEQTIIVVLLHAIHPD
jgi:hypothetical protein